MLFTVICSIFDQKINVAAEYVTDTADKLTEFSH